MSGFGGLTGYAGEALHVGGGCRGRSMGVADLFQQGVSSGSARRQPPPCEPSPVGRPRSGRCGLSPM